MTDYLEEALAPAFPVALDRLEMLAKLFRREHHP
jgi:hypothetical protein